MIHPDVAAIRPSIAARRPPVAAILRGLAAMLQSIAAIEPAIAAILGWIAAIPGCRAVRLGVIVFYDRGRAARRRYVAAMLAGIAAAEFVSRRQNLYRRDIFRL